MPVRNKVNASENSKAATLGRRSGLESYQVVDNMMQADDNQQLVQETVQKQANTV